MRRFRPRWLSALLGGIVLPFDPVLGMVMLMVGLCAQAKARPQSPEVKVYLGRAVSGELGPRSLEAIQLAHRALT